MPPSDDGSEDGPRPSTGSFKTNVGTKGASFTVDDWQPDFNGSEISAQGQSFSLSKLRKLFFESFCVGVVITTTTMCILFYHGGCDYNGCNIHIL